MEAFQIKAHYEKEALNFWRDIEMMPNTLPDSSYMGQHSDVNPRMRQFAICFMTEQVYKVAPTSFPDTLHSAASVLDRFLCKRTIQKESLMFVMLASLSLATKLNHTGRRLGIDSYMTKEKLRIHMSEVVHYEYEILKELDFGIFTPTTSTFFMAFAKVGGLKDSKDEKCFICLGHYLAGLTLLDIEMLKYKPSLIAASIIFFSRFTLKRTPWTKILQDSLRYTPTELQSCVLRLQQLTKGIGYEVLERYPEGPPIRKIYSQEENYNVASFLTEDIPDLYFHDIQG